MSLSLISCSAGGGDQCASVENPAECRAWTNAGGDIQDYLVGGMAGYMLGSMMSGGRQQQVIMRDPSYHGSYRHLRSPIVSRERQVQRLERKVARQKLELQRQQAANASKKAEIKSLKAGKSSRSFKSSKRSSWGSSSSRRSSRKK